MPRRVWWTASAVALLVVDLAAQTTQRPAPAVERPVGAITGIVFDAATKQPVPQAIVTLGVFAATQRFAWQGGQLTDDRGRFAFVDLPPGEYGVVAQKAGYLQGRYGGADDGLPMPIRLNAGEWFSSASVALGRPGSLSGTVRDESGETVVGVFVRALARISVAGVTRLAPGPMTETDDRGMYRFGNLRPGRYAVIVPSVVASVPASAAPEQVAGISRARIEAAQRAGTPLPVPDPVVEVDSGTRFVLRGYPIPPPPSPGRLAYPIAFAGGGWGSEAAAYAVEAGAHLRGVDVTLRPAEAARISGRVEGPADALPNLTLRLRPDGLEDLGVGGEAATALVAADGSFTFGPVPAGTYVIEASPSVNSYQTLSDDSTEFFYGVRVPRSPGETGISTTTEPARSAPPGIGFMTSVRRASAHWARTRVSVGPPGASSVVVTLQPARTLQGRIVATPASNQPAAAAAPRSIRLESADGSPAQGIARSGIISDSSGAFTISGILPGRYVVRGDAEPWLISSVVVDGRDHTHRPIEIGSSDISNVVVTFTNEPASLSGTVRDAAGLVAGVAGVVAFPIEPDQWIDYGLTPRRIVTARAVEAGTFRIPALPAGTYHIVAVPAERLDDWREPGFFRSVLPGAERVTVAWGEERIHDVRLQSPN